jgi:ABC-2 type transport system permease protein
MRLVLVELSRLFSRRAVALLLLAATALTILVTLTTVWGSRPVSAQELASARAQVREQVAQPGFQADLRSCQQNPEQFFGPGASAGDCEHSMTPTTAQYLSRAPLSLARELDSNGLAVVVIVTALMIIVGTTYAGADWATGSMSNQLLFEPRRGRVWLAKASAVTVGCLAVALVLVAAFWVTLYLVAQSRGYSPATGVLRDVGWSGARGVLLAGVAGLGGYALSMLLRSTVATLALLFAYAAGGEALVPLMPVQRASSWSLGNNVFAWLRDGVRVFDGSVVCGPSRPDCVRQVTVGLPHAVVYLGVLLVVTMVLSLLFFRRRDVP